MAKTQKFSEDLLLEAVVKYSETVKTKIKATELAAWSRLNVPGLEDVRDYHFTRPMKEKNDKNGKIIERSKLCTERINEINKSRSIRASINNNILLCASKVDAVFDLPLSVQKKLVVETRETLSSVLSKNRYLQTENEALKIMNKEQEKNIEKLEAMICSIQKKHAILQKQVNYLLKITDENSRREMLAQMGIEDDVIDINKYKNCIENEMKEMFDIEKELRKYRQENTANKESFAEEILRGINFDC